MPFRFITKSIHAYLIDYPVAIILIGAPFVLKLGQSGPVAMWLSVVFGVAALLLKLWRSPRVWPTSWHTTQRSASPMYSSGTSIPGSIAPSARSASSRKPNPFEKPVPKWSSPRAPSLRSISTLRAASGWSSPAGRLQALPVRWVDGGVDPAGSHHALSALAAADGLALVPPDVEKVRAGDVVQVLMLR